MLSGALQATCVTMGFWYAATTHKGCWETVLSGAVGVVKSRELRAFHGNWNLELRARISCSPGPGDFAIMFHVGVRQLCLRAKLGELTCATCMPRKHCCKVGLLKEAVPSPGPFP